MAVLLLSRVWSCSIVSGHSWFKRLPPHQSSIGLHPKMLAERTAHCQPPATTMKIASFFALLLVLGTFALPAAGNAIAAAMAAAAGTEPQELSAALASARKQQQWRRSLQDDGDDNDGGLLGDIIDGAGEFLDDVACELFGEGCPEDDASDSSNSTTTDDEEEDEEWDPLGDIACGLFGVCGDDDDGDDNNSNSTQSDDTGDDDPLGTFLDDLACGLFGACDENSTTTSDGAGDDEDWLSGLVGDVFYGITCGIFEICDDETRGDASNSTSDCATETDGILGGRPWFGECGIIAEFLGGVFNDTSDAIDDLFNGTADGGVLIDFDNPNDPFTQLFAEGGLLFDIFNSNSDVNLWQTILESFQDTTDKFAFGFIEDWAESATVANETTCNTTTPECFDQYGNEGFWVCRTLFDPFSGLPGSRSVCIGEGAFLDGNDSCDCCEEGEPAVPTCPEPCPCPCDLDNDGVIDGVWITSEIGLGAGIASERCVDPKWAVSTVSRFSGINCLETCA